MSQVKTNYRYTSTVLVLDQVQVEIIFFISKLQEKSNIVLVVARAPEVKVLQALEYRYKGISEKRHKWYILVKK